jgi:hypothetical protein
LGNFGKDVLKTLTYGVAKMRGLNQDFISLFLKMPVESKYVFYFVMPHGCKTNTINKTHFSSSQAEPNLKGQVVPGLVDPYEIYKL